MTTAAVSVKLAYPSQAEQMARVIAAAFRDLDASMWLAEGDQRWLDEHYWQFFHLAYTQPAMISGRGVVYTTADEMAAAVWLHEEPWHDRTPTGEFLARLAEITGPHLDRFTQFGEMLDLAHSKVTDTPHDYLGVIGVHPSVWRQGSGRALMQAHLTQLDNQGRPAYLEAADPTKRDIWAKFGFEVVDTITLPGTEHQLFPMWRSPKG